jgi:hypothetical protein
MAPQTTCKPGKCDAGKYSKITRMLHMAPLSPTLKTSQVKALEQVVFERQNLKFPFELVFNAASHEHFKIIELFA